MDKRIVWEIIHSLKRGTMGLLVIDGNSILNRAFYGIRLLSNKKGVYTNAITGFMNIFLKLKKEIQPDKIAVAFDLKAPTFRHLKYDGYKANRKGMPEELAVQMPYVKEILSALGIKIVAIEGFEADDVLGTLSNISAENKIPCVLSTGDRDSFQLINEYVTVRLASNKEDIIYTPDKIMEVYGVSPKQMIEVKALMGDSSDNIPGVAGIGEKTALSLIQKYSSVEYIYQHLSELEVSAGVRTKLENGREMCFMSRELAEICLTAPVNDQLDFYIPEAADQQKLADILTELEMFGLLKKLNVTATAQPVSKGKLSDSETAQTNQDETQKQSQAEMLCDDADNVIFIDGNVYAGKENSLIKIDEEMQKEYFASNAEKRTFNLKELYAYCLDKGFELNNVTFDTTLSAYLLNVNSTEYSLERLCVEYSVPVGNTEDLQKLGECLFNLNSVLFYELNSQGMEKVLTEIEMPLAYVLCNMERDGVKLDIKGVEDFGAQLDEKIKLLEQEIYGYAGKQFNIGSPKQLGVVLFEELMLPTGKKTKTGYSTNADVLDFLSDKHPIAKLIIEYRTLTKLKNTYVSGLLKVVSDDGRIHSTFKQTETRTGRISSAEPNIQNIPVRTEIGRNMRKFFVAKEGYKLIDADYSQIELRVLAHISDDEIMKNAFIEKEDIHTITASQVFNQPVQWVTPELRSKAKAVNFGIVYGIGAFSLSKDINVSVKEADTYIKAYLAKYHGVSAYMDRIVADAAENGYVTTMHGRRRFISEIQSKNKVLQALGKRIAMNTPIQGTAADIIKIAMIRVFEKLKESGLDARLILQVHDELIVEARADCAEKIAEMLKEEMENAVKLSIPMTADVEIGDTWFDTH